MKITKNLKPYQSEFLMSDARFPALVSAWATGKTMCGIARVLRFCERFKDNLFCVFRKEYTDLRDSTCKDWEKLTGLTINSSRECKLPSGSTVMFRHLEEMNNLSNINLGGFWIEQAEELETDEQFHYLRGRLRREGCEHTGFVTANTRGQNWIYKQWKSAPRQNYALWEATTWDNVDNLPASYTDDLRELEKEKPKIYRRFVLNSWDDDDVTDQCISLDAIRRAQGRLPIIDPNIRRIIGVDVARGGADKTVCYALENYRILGTDEWEKRDTMETVGRLLLFAEHNKSIKNFAVDELNAGAGVVDRLRELGKTVTAVNSSERAGDPRKYKNVRAEVWGTASALFDRDLISLQNADSNLIEQLKWSRWKSLESSGVLQVEPKEDIISRYGRSPDNADAYLYGLWSLEKMRPEIMVRHDNAESGWIRGAYIPVRWQKREQRQPAYY